MSDNKTRDGEATKRKIIKAAGKLFSEKGFNGVSIRDLANACGLSGPLILHHFKSKDGIYDAVRLALVEKYIPLFEDTADEEEDLPVFIEKVIRGTFEFHRENPMAMRLISWDRLNGHRKIWPKVEEFERRFTSRVQKAMDKGEISNNFSAKYFGIMIGGMVHLWWEKHELTMHEKLGKKFNADEAMKIDEAYIQQILLFVKNSLKIKGNISK